VLRTNNQRVARFEPAGTPTQFGDAPRVLLGSSGNVAIGEGATVSGGGSTRNDVGTLDATLKNVAGNPSVTVRFATVSGGQGNQALGGGSVVVGGIKNQATGDYSTAGGGGLACAGGDYSWAGGQLAKVRVGNEVGDGTCGPGSGDSDGDEGTFIWNGNIAGGLSSTGPGQFLIGAPGGMAINANNPSANTDLTLGGSGNLVLRSTSTTTGVLDFGATTRQMLNLWGGATGYGIGVQTGRMYYRVPNTGGFNWFVGGTHSDTADSPGTGGTWRMHLGSVGNLLTSTGTIGTLSDARLKNQVHEFSGALDRINALRPVNYHYIQGGKAAFQPAGEQVGFIAQELQQVFPDWVLQGDDGYLQLSMRGFEAVAVRGMQELSAENAELRDELEQLRQQNAQVRQQNAHIVERLEALESR